MLAVFLGSASLFMFSYLSMALIFVARTAASSLTRCGLLPVFSSCWIAPTTISSLIPSISTLLSPSLIGEGGGDKAAARLDLSSFMRMAVDRGGLMSPTVGVWRACDRLGFLTGGSSPSTAVLGGEGCATGRERFITPSPSRQMLFRRVL